MNKHLWNIITTEAMAVLGIIVSEWLWFTGATNRDALISQLRVIPPHSMVFTDLIAVLIILGVWYGAIELNLMKKETGKSLRITVWLKTQFKKWALYNVLTFAFLSMFYIPYNLLWLQLSPTQFLKWLLTAGIFGSLVNIVMRPFVGWVTRMLDRRYPKK